MGLTRDELRCWSRYIRDVLAPSIARGGEEAISRVTINGVHVFLADLSDTAIDLEILKFSKVHMALMEMVMLGSGWSSVVKSKVEIQLSIWEERFGDLQAAVKTDLWAAGGRMEGVARLDDYFDIPKANKKGQRGDSLETQSSTGGKVIISPWIVMGGKGPLYPLSTGHNGFEVGDWWIEAAAAYRDGIIDGSMYGITADETRAYAIVMTADQEIEMGADHTIRYKAPPTDPSRFKLMRNLASHHAVRVLRTSQLDSRWKPKAGLRYDGLYRVMGHGIKLNVNSMGMDEWRYTYDLQREGGQASIDKALSHPAADEMDDWDHYEREKAKK